MSSSCIWWIVTASACPRRAPVMAKGPVAGLTNGNFMLSGESLDSVDVITPPLQLISHSTSTISPGLIVSTGASVAESAYLRLPSLGSLRVMSLSTLLIVFGLSTAHRIALHAARVGGGFHAILLARGGHQPALRPIRSDLDDMTAFPQVRDGGGWHAVFDDEHARASGAGPEGRREMLSMPRRSIDRFLKIVARMDMAEEELGNPLVLLVSTRRAPGEIGFTVPQSHCRRKS